MSADEKAVTAAILVIGDEILSGRTKDRNVGYIAEYLTNMGVELREARVVPDVEDEIVAAVRTATSPNFVAQARAVRNPYGDGTASEKIVNIMKTIQINGQLLYKEMAH